MSTASTPAKTPRPSWADIHNKPFNLDLAAPREPEIYWRAYFMQELEEARKYEYPFLASSRYDFDPLSDISSKEIEDPLYSIKLCLDTICQKQSYLEAIASTIRAYPKGEALELLAPFYLSEMEEALEPLSYSFARDLAKSITDQGGIPTEEIRRALNDTIWDYDESLFSIVNALLDSKCLEGLYLPIGKLRLAFHTASEEILHQLQRFCTQCEGEKTNCFTTSNARAGAILDTIKQTLLELSLCPRATPEKDTDKQVEEALKIIRGMLEEGNTDFTPSYIAETILNEPKWKDKGYWLGQRRTKKGKLLTITEAKNSLSSMIISCLSPKEKERLGLGKIRLTAHLLEREGLKPTARKTRKTKKPQKRLGA